MRAFIAALALLIAGPALADMPPAVVQLQNNQAAALQALGSGTPGSGTFLRGDGTWTQNATTLIPTTAAAQGGTAGLSGGPYACAGLPTVTWGMVCLGSMALAMETNAGSETVAVGPSTFAEVTGQYGNTGIGEHVAGFDPSISYATMGGNDSGRDAFGLSGSTTWGATTLDDGELAGPNSVFGGLSVRGNSIGVKLAAATPVQGDTYQIVFTTSAACGVAPCTTIPTSTASYTVPATPTLSGVANGISTAINNLGICYNSPQPAGAPAQCTSARTSVSFDTTGNYYVTLHTQGGTTTGVKLLLSPACTGTCTAAISAVASFTGQGNVVSGYKVMSAPQLGAASYNSFVGDYIAQNAVGSLSNNAGIGYQGMNNATNDTGNAFVGVQGFNNAKGLTNSTCVGYKCGTSVGSGAYDLTLLGYYAGGASYSLTGHDLVMIGTNNQCSPPSAGQSNYFGICTGNSPQLYGGSFGSTANSYVVVTGDFISGNGAAAMSTSATTGFIHLPWSAGAPTGTPGYAVGTYGPACEVNTSSNTLNCYIGSSWYHIAFTSGAG